jgi:leucyl aminopeptidase
VAARATWLARDLTNTPPSIKNPDWMAEEVTGAAAKRTGLDVRVLSGEALARFGGLRAVGGGSKFRPCLVELTWSPPGATAHVVLVGKGITFDSGGISIKTREGMKRMKNDMAGAAAVAAATLGAADLGLPVRITALLPLAENAVSGSAYRPGDVITHYDGTTSESTNSDAEGRLVLADALGYAVAELDPDVVHRPGHLTGRERGRAGQRHRRALQPRRRAGRRARRGRCGGRRADVAAAAARRLPRVPAQRHRRPAQLAGPGRRSVVAALFLQEFLGDRTRWAHLDMSAPAWAESDRARPAPGRDRLGCPHAACATLSA